MSIQGRIEELSNRHRRLDQEIYEEQKRPAADEVRLHDLKRKKLKIKEELVTLRPN
ncbi:YdcH family protein [Henriciella aquimarina]|uniref:YdcH family protein n=1 Tax=Henriciella aquimarina TaxID=545261 RepID=UPI000A059DFF|nr:YdcH family protein [Henriciella aquimarina]